MAKTLGSAGRSVLVVITKLARPSVVAPRTSRAAVSAVIFPASTAERYGANPNRSSWIWARGTPRPCKERTTAAVIAGGPHT